jgi:hypothetical protein
MSVSGDEITVSLEVAIGVVLGVIVPVLLYFWRMHSLASNHKTSLSDHIEKEEKFLEESLEETKKVKYAIRELSHFSKWLAEMQTGKKPPPYVRNGD